jgi:hypothetical protein
VDYGDFWGGMYQLNVARKRRKRNGETTEKKQSPHRYSISEGFVKGASLMNSL